MLAARERMTQYVRVARLCRKLRDRWTALDTAGHRYGRYGTAQPRVIERPEAAKETAEKEMGNTCAAIGKQRSDFSSWRSSNEQPLSFLRNVVYGMLYLFVQHHQ